MQALRAVAGYFLPSTTQPEPIVIEGKRDQVLENYVALVAAPLFENATLEQLGIVKRTFRIHQLPSDHPAHKKLNAAIEKHSPASLRKVNKACLDVSKNTLLGKTLESTPSVFVQNNLTIDQVKAAIKKEGGNWNVLVLNNLDDPMMEMIVEYCRKLTTLQLVISGKQNPSIFSNFGLHLISTIPQLNTLELNFLDGTRIGSGDFYDLFNEQNLQRNIISLSVTTNLIGDAHLACISKFTNLRNLTICSGFFTSSGVNQFLQSSSMKNTLESINILGNSILFNAIGLTALSALPKIREVTLNGGWEAQDQNIIDFLKAKPDLKVLGISGYSISQEILDQIVALPQLLNLALGDCLKVTSFNNLAQNLSQLGVLLLDHAQHFNDADFSCLAKWEHLTSLSLLGADGLSSGFEIFCSSPLMEKNLKTFHFSGNEAVCSSRALGSIGRLGALSTLRLENLSYFNDDSLRIMSEMPIASNLEALELNGVSIENDSLKRLSEFKKMNTLMLSNCRSLTERGMKLFMYNLTLQTRLSKLYLDGVSLDDEMLYQFNNFENLIILYLCNLQAPSENNKTLKHVWKLPTMLRNHTFVELGSGSLIPFEQFIYGQN